MSDRFLEQRINIKFCAKLRKNAKKKVSLEMKHGAFNMIRKQEAKSPMVTADITMTRESSHVGITNEDNANHFLRYQGYCSL
jgi:hypothetical protein